MHQQEAAGRLVDVHDAVCADSVLVHQPAQLDEQPVRVGLLLLRAVELFHALGGLLVAQVHAVEEPSNPPFAASNTLHPHLRTRSTSNVQQLREPVVSDVAVSAQQPQSNCLFTTEKTTMHTTWNEW